MSRQESIEHSGGINPENITGIAARWFALPVYVDLPPEEDQRVERLSELEGDVKEFIERHQEEVRALITANREVDALRLINERLAQIDSLFSGDAATTARVYILRRRAYTQEYLATKGGYSQLPLGNPTRSACFLAAASDYMQADLMVGCVTDYALRVSECFGGARARELQIAALQKVFSGFNGNVVLMEKGGVNDVMLEDLVRRSTETTVLGNVPGGGEAKVIKGKLPEARNN